MPGDLLTHCEPELNLPSFIYTYLRKFKCVSKGLCTTEWAAVFTL